MSNGIDKAGADRAAQATAQVQGETARTIALAIAAAIAQLAKTREPRADRDALSIEGEKVQPLVKIKVGGRNVFVGRGGEEPEKNAVSESVLAKIRTAIERPEDYRGVFSIQVGGEVVYRVQNGEVELRTLDREELKQAVANVFNDFNWENDRATVASQESAESDRSMEPQVETPVPDSTADLRDSLQRELTDMRLRMQTYEDRLAKLEKLVESGQLVPVSEAASQALAKVEGRSEVVRASDLLQNVNAIAKDAVQVASTQVQLKREQLAERFARNVVRPIQLAESAAKTKLASVTLHAVGHNAFLNAATVDVLQKASLVAHVSGQHQNDGRAWSDERYEVRSNTSGLVVSDRQGERGDILATQGRTVTHNQLQLRDVALIGEVGIKIAQQLAAVRQSQVAVNRDSELSSSRQSATTPSR
ncbi:MAG: hypothetical protein AAF704_13060 [Cyanobacteria bacterium P01_D01_bin.123]